MCVDKGNDFHGAGQQGSLGSLADLCALYFGQLISGYATFSIYILTGSSYAPPFFSFQACVALLSSFTRGFPLGFTCLFLDRRLTTLSPGLSHRDLDGPALPADLLLAPHGEPGLAALLLEELDRDLAPARGASAAVGLLVELAGESGDALVDHGLELDVVDQG